MMANSTSPLAPPVDQELCPPREEWQTFLDGRVQAGRRTVLEEHFDGCENCRRVVDSLASPTFAWSLPRRAGAPLVTGGSPRLLRFARQHAPFDLETKPTLSHRPPPDLPGFENLVEVGRGGSGTVYRGWQTSLNREVAIKVVSPEAMARDRHRIQLEAQALARLRHPHVVAIHQSGLLHETAYIVMEWVEGGSLQDRIEAGPLEIREVAHLIHQLAEALEAVHGLGIIHRDLKPANVLLATSSADHLPTAKLTDFGFAKDSQQQHRHTISGAILGTPSYMAPEQTGLVPALGIPGPPCDIYGLGAVAFASLTGRPPHEGVSTLDTLVRVAWDEPTWIPNLCPDVPADFAAIIAKCLRTKPAERYGTARELARDLDHFLEGRPVSARPATWFEKGWKWIRRHPAPSIATGLLILLVALGLAGTTYHLWTQKRSLAELSEAKQKVEAALQIAVTSANAERQSRLEAIEELRLAAQVPIALLDTIPEVTAKHWELMDPVRQRLRVQVDRLQTREQETGEVLVRWLIALGMLAQDRFGRHKEAFEDLKLALDVSRRFPDSGKFRDLEAQTLMVRWTLAQRSGQTAEEEEVLSEIGELCDRLQSQPALGISLEKSLYLGGSLHARGHFTPALKVISIALQHQRRLLQEQSDKQVWSGFVTLLLLQAQLQHALGDEAGLASSLAVWSESRETMLGDPAELSELIRKTSLELLPLKMFLADRGGAPQQVAALLEEGLQLLAVGDRQNPGTQQPLIHRLRFLRAVHRLNLRAITRDALQSQIDATITQARAELRNQTPIGAWKTLGEDYARVIAPP
jgi:hypothetical protein